MNELIKKIKSCESMPQLDELRLELVTFGKSEPSSFTKLQDEFRKKKNQLNRIPLFDRTW
jgi:hypothetical protein